MGDGESGNCEEGGLLDMLVLLRNLGKGDWSIDFGAEIGCVDTM